MYDAACVFVCVGGGRGWGFFECVWDACVCVYLLLCVCV